MIKSLMNILGGVWNKFPDHLKTQEICNKDPYNLEYVSDKFKHF